MTKSPLLAICAIAFAIASSSPSFAAEPAASQPSLDDMLRRAARYEYGQERDELSAIEEMARRSNVSLEKCKNLAAKLRPLLASDATLDCKRFVCRQLALIGTEEDVPALAALLPDKDLSDMARFALENISGPAAPQALLAALENSSGKQKVGMVNSLGKRGGKQAVGALIPLLGDPDQEIAKAAIFALGAIGGPEASDALMQAKAKAAPELRPAVMDALLSAAAALSRSGEKGKAEKIYESAFAPDQAPLVRAAALEGLVAVKGQSALPLVIEALKTGEGELRQAAFSIVRTFPGNSATTAFAGLADSVAEPLRPFLLTALADRGDPAARPAALAAVKSSDSAVRISALRALGRLGDARDVLLLAQQASTGSEPERQAAAASLARLRGTDIDAAILAAMKKADAKARIEMIVSLASRASASSVPALLEAAKDPDPSARAAAFKVMGELTTEKDLPVLVALAREGKTGADRAGAVEALAGLAPRLDDRAKAAAAVAEGLSKETAPPAKSALLEALGRIGSDKSLTVLRSFQQDKDPGVQNAAFRALAGWPTDAPLEDMRKISHESKDEIQRSLALRALIRMTGLSETRPSAETLALYREAMGLAPGEEEKKLVLAGLAKVQDPKALEWALSFLADPALKSEGTASALSIASLICDTHPAEAKAAVDKVIASTQDESTRQQARDVLTEKAAWLAKQKRVRAETKRVERAEREAHR